MNEYDVLCFQEETSVLPADQSGCRKISSAVSQTIRVFDSSCQPYEHSTTSSCRTEPCDRFIKGPFADVTLEPGNKVFFTGNNKKYCNGLQMAEINFGVSDTCAGASWSTTNDLPRKGYIPISSVESCPEPTSFGDHVADQASFLIGHFYSWGGQSRDSIGPACGSMSECNENVYGTLGYLRSGYDCAGVTRKVFYSLTSQQLPEGSTAIRDLPANTNQACQEIPFKPDNLKRGDFLWRPGHVSIYDGFYGGKHWQIDALCTGRVVAPRPLDTFTKAFRCSDTLLQDISTRTNNGALPGNYD